jgi:mRNA interferase MazF
MVMRGEVYFAQLSPVQGSEQGGVRPVLVVQNDVGNFHSPTIIIAPISTAGKHYLPVHIRIGKSGGLSRDSTVFLEQIRTIDRQRIRHYVGTLDGEMMRKIDNAIKISLGV